ncbi:two-component sensor histidine kinase [Streptomyces sp. SID8379]|uniref:sensor histidine kinase n=1 Tax=unclassified Streptomyces TaxID=2593676 RepID=UPI000369A700|nr:MULTISPECIES: histidine kinase [unclassified Streptomyces]MYW67633.1 two-component sensor histidine kinase [Streptomyces sp. SID8379]
MQLTLPRPPHRDDVRIAVAGLLGGLLLWGIGLRMNTGRLLDGAWVIVPLVAMAGLELVRRTLPWCAVAAGTLVLVADQFTQGSLATVLMYTDLVYAAVLYGSPAAARRIPVASGLLTVAATLGALAGLRRPEALLIGVAVGLLTLAPATTGVLVRNHRETAAAERLRAEQTALLAEMDRTQAVTAERARMARELHDMVANHLSAIAIHSTAALSIDDPATTRTALETIRENSVDGLAEMRRLIGILRDAGGDTEPAAAPTLDGLGALVEQSRANGLDAALTVTGATEGLPAPVGLAAYRIVQESLTNALKHASPGRVTVDVERTADRIEVRVSSPYGDRDGPRAPGSGAGLVGMRERTALLAGTFDAGPEEAPDAAGGKVWRVRATLPLDIPVTEGDPA